MIGGVFDSCSNARTYELCQSILIIPFQKGRVLAQDGMLRSRAETWIQAQA